MNTINKSISILRYNNFKVHSNETITNNDHVNLRKLYNPLIGSLATSLYLQLYDQLQWNYSSMQINDFSALSCFLKCSNLDLNAARLTLEGYGLLEVFEDHEQCLTIFKLNRPMDANNFKKHPVWSTYLKKAVGVNLSQRVLATNKFDFESNNLSNVTASWLEFSKNNPKQELVFKENYQNYLESKGYRHIVEEKHTEQIISNDSMGLILEEVSNEEQNNAISVDNKYDGIKLLSISHFLFMLKGINAENNELWVNAIREWKLLVYRDDIVNLAIYLSSNIRNYRKDSTWIEEIKSLIKKIKNAGKYSTFEEAENYLIGLLSESNQYMPSIANYKYLIKNYQMK